MTKTFSSSFTVHIRNHSHKFVAKPTADDLKSNGIMQCPVILYHFLNQFIQLFS
jgi:hypothetical protein